jgi:CRP-like cAMP-binding protein
LALKLHAFTKMSADDDAALLRLSQNVLWIEARRDLISEGEKPTRVHLVLEGWAARYKGLPDGKRPAISATSTSIS